MGVQLTEIFLAIASMAAQPNAEQPTSKWRVDYGETQCVALRLYGKRTLAIRSAPNGESFEIMLMEPGMTGRVATQSEGSISFGGAPLRSTVLVYSDRKSKTKIFKFRLAGTDMQHVRKASKLILRAKWGDEPLFRGETRILSAPSASTAEFALTQAAAALDELEKCAADLRRHWNDGIEPPVVATPAQGNLHGLFSGADYPAEAIRRDQQGTTRTILLIDKSGKVASCYNAEPSGIAAVDAISCQVITKRAKFTPARDARGNAVKSIYYSPRITFQLS